MHKALIHIGIEKTGSTSVQNFLLDHERQLRARGIFFPHQSCGLISHFRLVLFTQQEPDKGLSGLEQRRAKRWPANHSIDADFSAWKTAFADQHTKHIDKLRKGLSTSKVIYSSEHFHSRIRTVDEIQSLKTYLDTLYDSIDICFYLRRQDRLAVSAHNTAIQGGHTAQFDFSRIKGTPHYYDFHSLASRWAEVFGESKLHPNVFEPQHMHDKSVVNDFAKKFVCGNDAQDPLLSKVKNRQSNPRLSYSALKTLIEFNNLANDDPALQGMAKPTIRQALITALHDIKDDYGELLPEQASAITFYERFKQGNEQLFMKWPGTGGFSNDFSMYPADGDLLPELDVRETLSSTLAQIKPAKRA